MFHLEGRSRPREIIPGKSYGKNNRKLRQSGFHICGCIVVALASNAVILRNAVIASEGSFRMENIRVLVFATVVLVAAATVGSLNGCGTSTPFSKIQHVVVIVQENRTPDNIRCCYCSFCS
jgi:phospholipase C